MNGIDQLKQFVIARYAGQSVWKTDNALSNFLKKSAQDFGDRDYESYLQQADYIDGVVILGNAMEHAIRITTTTSDLTSQLMAITFFWRAWYNTMVDDGVIEHVRSAWQDLLHAFDGTLVSIASLIGVPSKGVICRNGMPAIDNCLNALIDPVITQERDEFGIVFQRWTEPQLSASHAATIIDFILRVRSTPHNAVLYRNALVRNLSFDVQICNGTFVKSISYIQRSLGQEGTQSLHQILALDASVANSLSADDNNIY